MCFLNIVIFCVVLYYCYKKKKNSIKIKINKLLLCWLEYIYIHTLIEFFYQKKINKFNFFVVVVVVDAKYYIFLCVCVSKMFMF